MSALLRKALPAADWLLVPFVWIAATLLKAVRRIGIRRLPCSRATLMRVGIYPVRVHYYHPQFVHRNPGEGRARHGTGLPRLGFAVLAPAGICVRNRQ